MRLPLQIRPLVARMRRTEAYGEIVAFRNQEVKDIGHSGTSRPLLAGDRQKEKRVAKARNPLQRGPLEVVFWGLDRGEVAGGGGSGYGLVGGRGGGLDWRTFRTGTKC